MLLNYDSGKYAISETEFERKDAKNKADLNNVALTAGTVYIALKMGSGEQAVSDLIDGGEDVTPTDEKTGDIVDEIDDNTINDALDNADLKDKKNILREVGADVFFTFGRAGEIVLTYDGKFKKDYQDHTGMVSLKINF